MPSVLSACFALQIPERWRQPLRIPPPAAAPEAPPGQDGSGADGGQDGSFGAMLAALLAGRGAAADAKDMSAPLVACRAGRGVARPSRVSEAAVQSAKSHAFMHRLVLPTGATCVHGRGRQHYRITFTRVLGFNVQNRGASL